ncbi:TetR/AcrR family transcriptional regulator [Pseudomonas sp. P105]|uniref:TetR/AcrR family transcriptional regulator n=1 Tax=Pseudomonas sp. P105 TaxID=3049542 RepID=UPI00293437D7|nr:TetR/AcrR family transcriptional regulator [Pseudomonas sp. P105]WNZ80925.1 TetR/AcrR family transcriptional regulator [Pseudomonas sp. P105]
MRAHLNPVSTSESISLHTNSIDHVRLVALELFVAKGFKGVSLRHLASAVGLQVGSLYSHIDSKEALLFELIDDYERELLYVLFQRVGSEGDPLERLRSYVDAYIRFLMDNFVGSLLARYEFRSLRLNDQDSVVLIRKKYQELLCGILQDGVAEKIFHVDSLSITARGLIALLDEMSGNVNAGTTSPEWLATLSQNIVARTVGVVASSSVPR